MMRTSAMWFALLVVIPGWCGSGGQQSAPAPRTETEQQQEGPPSPLSVSPGPQGGAQVPTGPVSVSPGPQGGMQIPPAPSVGRAGSANDPAKLATSPSTSGVTVGSAPVDAKSYIIGPEDVLGVQVWQVREITGQYLVRPDGKISVPLAGEISAAGRTPEQVNAELTDILKQKYINSPDVTVSVIQVNSKKYYIHGEVANPGAFPLIVPMTVLEGLANAHGFKDFANLKKIRIMRGKEQLKFNYKEVTHGKHTEENIYLQPGDEIIVP